MANAPRPQAQGKPLARLRAGSSEGSAQALPQTQGQVLNGYLNVLKPPGMTSHNVIGRLRRLTGLRRIGHAGTLDPAAAGVLPVAIGSATRTLSSHEWDVKLYWADVRFGASTDTDDAEGMIREVGDPGRVDLEAARAVLPQFLGDIRQRPPAYSAVRVEGRRAYAEARRGAPQELPERAAHIDAIAVLGWEAPVLSLLIQCRSGTYIRSIARDLGMALACPAHLSALVRLRVGPFAIRDALTLAALETIAGRATWDSVLWPPDIIAAEMKAIVVARPRLVDFGYGRSWRAGEGLGVWQRSMPASARVYAAEGALVGFVTLASGDRWQPSGGLPTAGVAKKR